MNGKKANWLVDWSTLNENTFNHFAALEIFFDKYENLILNVINPLQIHCISYIFFFVRINVKNEKNSLDNIEIT